CLRAPGRRVPRQDRYRFNGGLRFGLPATGNLGLHRIELTAGRCVEVTGGDLRTQAVQLRRVIQKVGVADLLLMLRGLAAEDHVLRGDLGGVMLLDRADRAGRVLITKRRRTPDRQNRDQNNRERSKSEEYFLLIFSAHGWPPPSCWSIQRESAKVGSPVQPDRCLKDLSPCNGKSNHGRTGSFLATLKNDCRAHPLD